MANAALLSPVFRGGTLVLCIKNTAQKTTYHKALLKTRLKKYVSESTHQKAELVGSACLIQHPAQSHRATQLKM